MAKHRNPFPTAEEKETKKRRKAREKWKKVGGIVLIAAAVCAVFWGISALFGNPITRMKASGAIGAYVRENFPQMSVSSVHYGRDSGEFYAVVTLAGSVDTHFLVYYKNGECRDYYADSVTDLQNTVERMENAWSEKVKETLTDVLGNGTVQVSVADFREARESGEFSVDMPEDTRPTVPLALHVTCEGEPTVAALSRTLKAVFAALPEEYDVARVNLTLKDGKTAWTAFHVTADDVASENLEALLSEAFDRPISSLKQTEEFPLYVTETKE